MLKDFTRFPNRVIRLKMNLWHLTDAQLILRQILYNIDVVY